MGWKRAAAGLEVCWMWTGSGLEMDWMRAACGLAAGYVKIGQSVCRIFFVVRPLPFGGGGGPLYFFSTGLLNFFRAPARAAKIRVIPPFAK